MALDNVITVKQLKDFCDKAIKDGNGDKHIFISQDDEGNGFHALFYQFTDDVSAYIEMGNLYCKKEDADKIIILG